MRSSIDNNIPRVAQKIRRGIKEILDSASFRVPKEISDACPHPGMKGYFGGNVFEIP